VRRAAAAVLLRLAGLPLCQGNGRGWCSSIIERRTDPGGYGVRKSAQWIDVAADIPAGHRQRLVAQHVADQEGVGAGRTPASVATYVLSTRFVRAPNWQGLFEFVL
jgi:hypothetical protein